MVDKKTLVCMNVTGDSLDLLLIMWHTAYCYYILELSKR